MVKRRYAKGLKEVVIKMEEMLGTEKIQNEMKEILGLPLASNASRYDKKKTNFLNIIEPKHVHFQ
jgi:hypothetical protein